jgi:hypothetical protein
MSLSEHIAEQARQVDRRPTEPQKAAGNYRKGHVRLHGLEIAIENPCGSFREGKGPDGKVWRCRLPAHYGYFKGSEGADGDHVDVFIGPHHKSQLAYVIDQHDHRTAKYDEAKVMLGFVSPAQARRTYMEAFSDGKGGDRIGALHEMTIAQLKDWLKDGNTKRPYKRADGGRVQPMPENKSSLEAQQKQLVEGNRHAQLFPGGKGELPLPKGMHRAKMDNGDVFHFNMKHTNIKKLKAASRAGRENEVLGLGPFSKHEVIARAMRGEHPVAVVERDGKGNEVRAAAGTHATASTQAAHMAAGRSRGNTVSLEHPLHTLSKRRAEGGGVQDDPNDLTNQYNTQLSPADETKFQTWAAQNPRLGNTYDYDARGFWQAGAGTADNGHGSDQWKKPNHPTFSDQSQYSQGDTMGGIWTQKSDGSYTFSPTSTNLKYNDADDLQDYFSKVEPSNQLIMPSQPQARGGKVKRRAAGGVAMADGGVPEFDDSSPVKPLSDQPVFAGDSPVKPLGGAPSGGLASYLPDAITDIPHEAYESTANAVRGIGQSWNDIRARHEQQAQQDTSASASFFDPNAFLGGAKDVIDTGKALLTGASLPFRPAAGAAESLIGHPMASAEHAVGTVINPAVAAHDNPQAMYEQAKSDVDTALSAARPRGFSPTGATVVPPAVPPEAVANQDLANQFGFRLSRGQARQDPDVIRYEDMAARGAYGPEMQHQASEFFNQQFQDMTAGGQDVGRGTARGLPEVENPAAASETVQSEVADRAARARQLQAQIDQRATEEAAARRRIQEDQGQAISDAIRGAAQPVSGSREAGEIVGQNVRDAATANRQEFQRLYREFGQLPGEFRADAVRGMGTRIRNDLSFRDEPVIVDDQLTPSASRAIQALDEMSVPRIQNRASPFGQPNPDEIAGVNLRGIDQMRKKLVAYYQAARNNPTDARATRAVLGGFDDQIERAITDGLFSGDPRALKALQQARASYSRYRQTFGPQRPGDDVGTAMRRIVDRNATPEEISNMVVGSGKIGNAGLPVRIADRLEQVLGADSDSWSAIRQAMWSKASQVRNAAGEVDPIRSANSIGEFTQSSLAQRMFTPQERAAMRSHAQGVRDLDNVIENLPETQAANRVRSAYQDYFGGENLQGGAAQVFHRMVEGSATPEEIANGLFKVIGAGNPGHVVRAMRAIERITGADSEAMAAIRQGVWQKLTQAAAGKDQPGAQKLAQSINEFLHGTGKTVAEHLYTPAERDLMDRYARAVKLTVIPKYARTNSDTAPALFHAIRKHLDKAGGLLGLVAEHGAPGGGALGYVVGRMIDKGAEAATAASGRRKLGKSLEDATPPPRKPPASPRFRQASRLPFSVQSVPTRGISNAVARIQGPVPASADEKKPKP